MRKLISGLYAVACECLAVVWFGFLAGLGFCLAVSFFASVSIGIN